MKHVTVADKSLLAGDEIVDLLIEYAVLLGQAGSADSVDVSALGPDGDEVIVTFLLNSGTTIVAETTHSTMPEPSNTKASQYLHDRVRRLRGVGAESGEDVAGATIWNAAAEE